MVKASASALFWSLNIHGKTVWFALAYACAYSGTMFIFGCLLISKWNFVAIDYSKWYSNADYLNRHNRKQILTILHPYILSIEACIQKLRICKMAISFSTNVEILQFPLFLNSLFERTTPETRCRRNWGIRTRFASCQGCSLWSSILSDFILSTIYNAWCICWFTVKTVNDPTKASTSSHCLHHQAKSQLNILAYWATSVGSPSSLGLCTQQDQQPSCMHLRKNEIDRVTIV